MITRAEIKERMTKPWTLYFTKGIDGSSSSIMLKSQEYVTTGTRYENLVTTGGSCQYLENKEGPHIVQLHDFIEPTEEELDMYEEVFAEGLKSIEEGTIYAFNDRGAPEKTLLCKASQIHARRFALSKDDKAWLNEKINGNTYSKTGIPVMGVMFDFEDALTHFVVKTDYGLCEYYAPDEKSLKAYLKTMGRKVSFIQKVAH